MVKIDPVYPELFCLKNLFVKMRDARRRPS